MTPHNPECTHWKRHTPLSCVHQKICRGTGMEIVENMGGWNIIILLSSADLGFSTEKHRRWDQIRSDQITPRSDHIRPRSEQYGLSIYNTQIEVLASAIRTDAARNRKRSDYTKFRSDQISGLRNFAILMRSDSFSLIFIHFYQNAKPIRWRTTTTNLVFFLKSIPVEEYLIRNTLYENACRHY